MDLPPGILNNSIFYDHGCDCVTILFAGKRAGGISPVLGRTAAQGQRMPLFTGLSEQPFCLSYHGQ